MTLIITEISRVGIAMSADSAIYDPITESVNPNGAVKLKAVPYLGAGLSFWGYAEINKLATERWLDGFIEGQRNSGITLEGFANKLAERINAELTSDGSWNFGIHVAGYIEYGGISVPAFYHVHDGRSTTLERFYGDFTTNRYLFNANSDITLEKGLAIYEGKDTHITRNGQFQTYAAMTDAFDNLIAQLNYHNFISIDWQNIDDRTSYLCFKTRMISKLLCLSSEDETVGGDIYGLSITPSGVVSCSKSDL